MTRVVTLGAHAQRGLFVCVRVSVDAYTGHEVDYKRCHWVQNYASLKKNLIFLKRQRSRDMPSEKANPLELVYTLSLGTLETQGGTTKGVCRLPYAIY